jgi:hypothetical protein
MTRFKKLIESVVAVAFQSVFCVEIYQNDVFFIFKKFIFKINASKRSKTYKKFDFLWNTICTAFPNVPQSIIIRKNDWFCI